MGDMVQTRLRKGKGNRLMKYTRSIDVKRANRIAEQIHHDRAERTARAMLPNNVVRLSQTPEQRIERLLRAIKRYADVNDRS